MPSKRGISWHLSSICQCYYMPLIWLPLLFLLFKLSLNRNTKISWASLLHFSCGSGHLLLFRELPRLSQSPRDELWPLSPLLSFLLHFAFNASQASPISCDVCLAFSSLFPADSARLSFSVWTTFPLTSLSFKSRCFFQEHLYYL